MNNSSPQVSFTKDEVKRIKVSGISGSAVVTNLIERLEKERSNPNVQAHTNHQKHFRDRN